MVKVTCSLLASCEAVGAWDPTGRTTSREVTRVGAPRLVGLFRIRISISRGSVEARAHSAVCNTGHRVLILIRHARSSNTDNSDSFLCSRLSLRLW